jgi:hypothetical protein
MSTPLETAREKILHYLDNRDVMKGTLFLEFLNQEGITTDGATEILRENKERWEEAKKAIEDEVRQLEVRRRGIDNMADMMDTMQKIRSQGPKEAMDTIEQRFPQLFTAAHPRRFEMPSGFANPKRFTLLAFWAMWEASELKDRGTVNNLNAHAVKVVSSIIEKQVPTYFVSQRIMQALINTDLPKDFSLHEMPWPMESMLFVIPEGTLVSEKGDITLVAIARCTARTYPNDWMKWGDAEDIVVKYSATHEGPDTACILAMTDDGSFFQWEAPIDAKTINDAASVKLMRGDLSSLGARMISSAADPEHEQFTTTDLPRATFQIILAMLACPEMIEAGVIVRHPSKKKGKMKCAIWAPNFFGKAYRRYDQIVGDGGEPGQKRTHWRRGHFRHQRFGEGRRGIKVIWIQPMLINKDRMETAA